MKRALAPIVLLAIIAALVAGAILRVHADRAPKNTLEVSGRVYAENSTVAVPLVASDSPTGTATPNRPTVAGRLAWVGVSAGSHVTAGEVVARLDAPLATSALALARAQAAESAAMVDLLAEKADTAASGKRTLASKRTQVRDALAQLRTKRAEVAGKLAQTKTLVAMMGQHASPQLKMAVVKLEAALAQMDAGIAKATAGLAKLESARAKVNDAITALGGAQDAASAAAQADEAGIAVAEARLDLYNLRSSVSGTVIEATPAGSVVYAAAPAVRILPDGAPVVEAYVTSSDARLFKLGTDVRVSADYLSHPLEGVVYEVAPSFGYPPTFQATNDTHMLRGVRVRARVEGSGLVPGAPVDLIVSTR